jgi:RNA polymerase sigma-70 factor, ECF subfamily
VAAATSPVGVSTINQKLDPDAIYRMHVHQVGRWVLRLGGPGVDVDDTVHDIFAIAFRRLASFRGDSSMATWLFGIADRVVRERRRRPRWWRRPSGSAEETAGTLPALTPNPFEAFEKAQAARSVYHVLDRLADGDRRILILFELEELSAEQVGELLGIKAANARLRLHRARARFLRVFQHTFPSLVANPARCENVSR